MGMASITMSRKDIKHVCNRNQKSGSLVVPVSGFEYFNPKAKVGKDPMPDNITVAHIMTFVHSIGFC